MVFRIAMISHSDVFFWNELTSLCEAPLYLKGCHTKAGQDLFSILSECKICNNGLKLKEARFWLNIRGKKLPNC